MNDQEFLLAIKTYIEESEERSDGEWGLCRPLQELVDGDLMPGIYHEALRRLAEISQ